MLSKYTHIIHKHLLILNLPLTSIRILLSSILFISTHSTWSQINEPQISAKSACIMHAQSGKILWQRNLQTQRYPASTTKILTALLLLEHTHPDEIITAPNDINSVGECSIYLSPGEKIRSHDLLKSIMLSSANDAAYAAAIHISKSTDAFSALMNHKAKQFGCTNTHFENPHGLHHKNHYTTAYDLALIAKEAMKNNELKNVVSLQKAKIFRENPLSKTFLRNKNKWLRKDPTANGVKTGYTRQAGKCYVGSVNRNNDHIITVILHSENWVQDHENLLDWTFENFTFHHLYPSNSNIQSVPVENGKKMDIQVGTKELISIPCNKNEKFIYKKNIIIPSFLSAPISKNSQVGLLEIIDSSGYTSTYPLISKETCLKQTSFPIDKVIPQIFQGSLFSMFFLISSGIYNIRRKRVKSGTTIV